MELIARQPYIEHILRYLGKGVMIALTGQRRVGKNYVLRQLAIVVKKMYPDANIVYINKEKKKFADIRNDADLSAYLSGKFSEDGDNYFASPLSSGAGKRRYGLGVYTEHLQYHCA